MAFRDGMLDMRLWRVRLPCALFRRY